MMTRLAPGDPAPDFSLPDDEGRTVSLRELRGRRVIVYFYPAAMTPGCSTQACDFSAGQHELDGSGYTVIGISPDPVEKLKRFRERDGLTITLLSDPTRQVLERWGAYGEKMLYGKKVTGVIRSTFVVGDDGTIEHAWYNVKATGHVAKVRRDLGLA